MKDEEASGTPENVPAPPEESQSAEGEFSFEGDREEREAPAGPEPLSPAASARREPFLSDSGLPLFYLALLLPVVAVLGLLLYPLQARLDRALSYPFALDAEEDFILKQGLDLARGETIYRPVEREPYLVGNYPPLLPAVLSLVVEPPADQPDALIVGRQVVGTFSLLAIMALLAAAFWRSRQLIPTFLAPLLFLISYEFYQWFVYVRVDLPALALTLLGLCAYMMIRPRWGAAVAAVVFVLAAYTRQTAIFAPAACCVVMLLYDRRRLLWFLPVYLGLGLGGFFLIDWWTGGEFYRHLVVYNRNIMDWNALRAVLRNEIWLFYRWWIVGIAAGMVCLGIAAFFRRRGDRGVESDEAALDSDDSEEPLGGLPHRHDRGLPLVWFLIASLGLLGFAKVGSAANYALEPLAAAALYTADLLGSLMATGAAAQRPARRWARAGLILMTLGLFVHALRLFPFSLSAMLPDQTPVQPVARFIDSRNVAGLMFSSVSPELDDMKIGNALVQVVRESPGDVLTESAIVAMLAGKDVIIQPFIMTQLAREGRWDPQPLIEDIRRQRFSVIITTEDLRSAGTNGSFRRYTPEMAQAIQTHYTLTLTAGPGNLRLPYYVWEPRRSEIRRENLRLTAGPLQRPHGNRSRLIYAGFS